MKHAKTLSKAELRRVLAVVNAGRHAKRNQLIVLLSYYAGLRAKEIAGLTVRDVYTETGDVKRIVLLMPEQTKGENSRNVIISRKLAGALKDFGAQIDNFNSQSPLIKSQKKHTFSANTMCQLMCRIYKDCGIAGASSHSGRRSFITNLANKGVHAHLLMKLAGHKHLATTQRYIDVNDKLLFEAVELV
jgi:integrase/recombinase XerD